MKKRLKFPLFVFGLFSAALALSYLYARLGLSPPFSLTATLLLSAVVADYGTTVKASRLGGKEGNPAVGVLFKKIGVEKGGLVVVGLFILVVIFMFRNSPPYQQLAVACVYWVVPINNLMVIRRLRNSKAEA